MDLKFVIKNMYIDIQISPYAIGFHLSHHQWKGTWLVRS